MPINNKRKDAGPAPIANQIPVKPDVPLDGGDFYEKKAIRQQMPFGASNVLQQNLEFNDEYDTEPDNSLQPGFFGRWTDAYGAFIGSYKLTEGPERLKRQSKHFMHILFMNDNATIMWMPGDNYMIGTASATKKDMYGRIIEGTFNVWDTSNNTMSNNQVKITPSNCKFFVTFLGNVFGIPPFLKISYYVKYRNFLWRFKNINVRLNILNKIIGLKDEGKDKMIEFLNDLFNMNMDTLPAPIKVLDVAYNDSTGEMELDFIDLDKNIISMSVPYNGNEINQDIEYLDSQIFRVLGLRTDTSSKTGVWQERSNTAQTENAHSYFDYREEEMMKSFEDFAYDFKEQLGITIKWESTFACKQRESEEKQNKLQKEMEKTNKNEMK